MHRFRGVHSLAMTLVGVTHVHMLFNTFTLIVFPVGRSLPTTARHQQVTLLLQEDRRKPTSDCHCRIVWLKCALADEASSHPQHQQSSLYPRTINKSCPLLPTRTVGSSKSQGRPYYVAAMSSNSEFQVHGRVRKHPFIWNRVC